MDHLSLFVNLSLPHSRTSYVYVEAFTLLSSIACHQFHLCQGTTILLYLKVRLQKFLFSLLRLIFSILFDEEKEISFFFAMKKRVAVFQGQTLFRVQKLQFVITQLTININKTYMTNPYFWNFPQRADTMYMSTIDNQSRSLKKMPRQSSFQLNDIEGASCRQNIPKHVFRQSFIYSTYVEPRPQFAKSVKKISDPLKHHDIEKSYPQAVQFKTNRTVNPLVPKYKLPSSDPVDLQPPAKFLRNTLDIGDIVHRKQPRKYMQSPKNQPVQGSSPSKLFRTLDSVSRLQVKDINNDGKFFSQRTQQPIDPLNPVYVWRDATQKGVGFSFTKSTLHQQHKPINTVYGEISGSQPKRLIPFQTKKEPLMKVTDIQGAHANSYNQSRYFNDKRKQFRNYMKLDDIEKTSASSLKKGITTNRTVNPLMPDYKYPQ